MLQLRSLNFGLSASQRILRSIFVCSFVLAECADCLNAESPPAKPLLFLQRYDQNCAALHSGEYEIRGKSLRLRNPVNFPRNQTSLYPDPEQTDIGWKTVSEIDLRFYSAFDHLQKLYRIDKSERGHSLTARKELFLYTNFVDHTRSTRWIATPSHNIQVFPDYKNEPLRYLFAGPVPADAVTTQLRQYNLFRPFLDVRSLPLLSYSKLETLDESYPDVLQRISQDLHFADGQRMETGEICFSAKLQTPAAANFVQVYCIDPAQRGMVTSREIREDIPQGKLIEWSRTSWQEVNNVMVPKTYQALRRRENSLEMVQLLFTWRRVNTLLASEVFELEGLDLPAEAVPVTSPQGLELYYH